MRFRQLAERLLILHERLGDFGQRGDGVVLARLQVRLFPLLGHRRQIQQQQSHREKLPLAAFAHESDAHRSRLLAGLPDFGGDKGEILAHLGRAEVHVGNQPGGFATQFGAASGGGREQGPARIVEQDEALQQSGLLRLGQGAKGGGVFGGEMSGERGVVLAAGCRQCVGERPRPDRARAAQAQAAERLARAPAEQPSTIAASSAVATAMAARADPARIFRGDAIMISPGAESRRDRR